MTGFDSKRQMVADKLQEPVGEQFKFWSVTGKYERQAFASLSGAEAYCKGLNTTFPEGDYVVRPLWETPPKAQPAQEPVAYVTGMSFGRFIVEPLNPAMVLPVGMALYSLPLGNK
jgi:hypothetical protein